MQNSRLRFIDLNYYTHRDITNPEQVLNLHAPSQGYAKFLNENVQVEFIKHANWKGQLIKENMPFTFFKGRNRFWYIPFSTHRYIKKQQPGFVLVQGFVFPLQLAALKILLGANTKIFVQHHGEKPFKGVKKIVQQFADRFISGYLFSGIDNAAEWLDEKVIGHKEKCFELLSASTSFTALNKISCREELAITGCFNFLWVGHLNQNKDPLTVITAFGKFAEKQTGARLYLIYQSADLLPQIVQLIQTLPVLQKSVFLVGAVPHAQLQKWYSACDYYISGSHREACGYALLEAMACGCIPVVTAIPSFKKITGNGQAGWLFEAGNNESLLNLLLQLKEADQVSFSEKVSHHFSTSLSFKKIAADLLQLISSIPSK